MPSLPKNSALSSPSPGKNEYAALSADGKDRALLYLFERAGVAITKDENPQARCFRLNCREISQCIFANSRRANQAFGKLYNRYHYKLLLAFAPNTITKGQLTKISVDEKLAFEIASNKLLDIEAETKRNKGESAHEVVETLDLWIASFPLRALIDRWTRMPTDQLLLCYSRCYAHVPFLVNIPLYSELISRLIALDLATLSESQKKVIAYLSKHYQKPETEETVEND